ncbi:MAG: hypothetical protein ABFE02_06880 [Sulfuricella sp.]
MKRNTCLIFYADFALTIAATVRRFANKKPVRPMTGEKNNVEKNRI